MCTTCEYGTIDRQKLNKIMDKTPGLALFIDAVEATLTNLLISHDNTFDYY